MKLIVGLGNRGLKYRSSRHNVGFLVLETLMNTNLCTFVSTWKLNKRLESEVALVRRGGEVVVLAKPQTLMNASGRAVKKLLAFYKVKPGELLVVHDDLDLRLGEYKLQWAKGPRVHNGVNSVEDSLGTKDFWRLRVGLDNRRPDNRIPGEEYVLQGFVAAEKDILEKASKEKLTFVVSDWLAR